MFSGKEPLVTEDEGATMKDIIRQTLKLTEKHKIQKITKKSSSSKHSFKRGVTVDVGKIHESTLSSKLASHSKNIRDVDMKTSIIAGLLGSSHV